MPKQPEGHCFELIVINTANANVSIAPTYPILDIVVNGEGEGMMQQIVCRVM